MYVHEYMCMHIHMCVYMHIYIYSLAIKMIKCQYMLHHGWSENIMWKKSAKKSTNCIYYYISININTATEVV